LRQSLVPGLFIQVSQIRRQFHLSLQLKQRSASASKKMPELQIAQPPVPFRNVTGDRDSGAPHLIG
jgi:hypothetical protein